MRLDLDRLGPQVRRLFGSLAHAGCAGHSAGTLDAPGAVDAPECRVHGEAGREARGTRVRFVLRVRAGRVIAARYQAYGCPHTLAVCEWLAQELEAGRAGALGGPQDWSRRLDVPMVKLGRLLVVEDALKAALSAARLAAAGIEKVVK